MNPSTQALVLKDIVDSLDAQGIRKLVLFNGHGGNDFRQMIRELQPKTSVFLCSLNWYQCVNPREYFSDLGDHAGELETSVMMHIAPDLVLPLAEAGDGAARRFRIAGLREGWVWSPRKWTSVTTDTGVGNPHGATAEKGARYVEAVTRKIAGFFTELAKADTTDLYE
jgi:creatinine amidohydrolase